MGVAMFAHYMCRPWSCLIVLHYSLSVQVYWSGQTWLQTIDYLSLSELTMATQTVMKQVMLTTFPDIQMTSRGSIYTSLYKLQLPKYTTDGTSKKKKKKFLDKCIYEIKSVNTENTRYYLKGQVTFIFDKCCTMRYCHPWTICRYELWNVDILN